MNETGPGGEGAPRPATRPPVSGGEVIAAIDLGSNSFHMKVARFEAGQLVVVDRLREMVRLAAGLDKAGNIDKAVQARALECLARFGQRIREMHAGTVRAVATNTFRKARKAGEFKRRAEKVLGHTIEVVSGREEARLVYSGVAHSSPQRGERLLVLDIGGGSTELIIGEGFSPRELFSLQMGCVSITRRFFADGRLTSKRMKKARIAARVELEPVVGALRASSWQEAIGASGTVRAAADVIAALGKHGPGMTLAGLEHLCEQIVNAGEIGKLSLPGLDPERAPVFPGGAIILETVFRELNIDTMRVSDGALREGILYDLVGRITHEDARDRSIRSLQERYNVDMEQAERVERTAAMLLGKITRKWDLEIKEQELLLRWAARTHELGLAIAHSGYHRHGAYLLENSDLPGFSTYEQARIAALVALHRKRFREDQLLRIRPDRRAALRKLSIILRLAVVLHRGRSAERLPELGMKGGGRKLRLDFGDHWLEAHPLTRADLEQEARYLEEAGFRLDIA